ncbi:MAG: hypothetical protein LBE82_09025 [Chitinophagaceae bacterium]|jgi:hypothetical protein|nr:hypothetical protein [Chitinophagaceae bacterium]
MNNLPLQNKTDLSHIKNSDDLLLEIKRVRRRVKNHEAELKSGLTQIPREVTLYALESAVPAFLRNTVTNKILSVFQGVIAFAIGNFLSKSGKGNAKNYFVSGAKQLGFLAAVEAVNLFFKKKKIAGK